MAVRLAMGVSRSRLAGQLLIETVLLFAFGGGAGLLLSRAMNAAILRTLPTLPLPSDASLVQDGRVVAFALGVSFAAAIVFGLAPARNAVRVDVLSLLKVHEHGAASSVRLRRVFVVAQVALSVVLVIAGSLLTRALGRAGSVASGFDAHGVDVVSIDLTTAGYTPAAGRLFVTNAARRLRALPGIDAVALASQTPVSGAEGFKIEVPGVRPPDGRAEFEVLANAVTPGYFATMRIAIVAGRDFVDADTEAAPRVAIVSESAVRRFWPSLSPQDAVGREIRLQPNVLQPGAGGRRPALVPITIVGIAADLQNGSTPSLFMYMPMAQQYSPAIKFLTRTSHQQRAIGVVRDLLVALDRRLPVLAAAALEDQAGPVTTQLRISAAIAGSLGIVGVLLAAIGIYGVTSYMVARRTREIGIRIALGAGRATVARMAIAETVRLIVIGAAAGLPLAAVTARLLRAMLFGLSPMDPSTFAGTTALFALVGLIASYLPVRRALAIDPSRALRYE
jgi:predicted permease